MENARKLDLRLVLGALAVAFAAAALWAATALAGGSSSATDPATSPSPAAAFVQDDGQAEPDDSARLPDDCPERGGEGEDDSGSSNTGGSDL